MNLTLTWNLLLPYAGKKELILKIIDFFKIDCLCSHFHISGFLGRKPKHLGSSKLGGLFYLVFVKALKVCLCFLAYLCYTFTERSPDLGLCHFTISLTGTIYLQVRNWSGGLAFLHPVLTLLSTSCSKTDCKLLGCGLVCLLFYKAFNRFLYGNLRW